MPEYFTSALFVYTDESSIFVEPIQQNPQGSAVTVVYFETLKQDPASLLKDKEHVVISGSIGFLKEMIRYSLEFHFSIGIIPIPGQKNIARALSLPDNLDSTIDLALRKDVVAVDIILCNEQILLFKASIGRVPMIDYSAGTNRLRIFSVHVYLQRSRIQAWEGARLVDFV